MHENTPPIFSISPLVLASEEIMLDVEIDPSIDMDVDMDQDYTCSHHLPQIIYPESSFQSFFNRITNPSRSMIDPGVISQLLYVDELQNQNQETEIDHEGMRIQDLFIHSEDEPDSQTELAKTIGQDDMEGPPSFMPIFTKNNLRMLYQKFPTPSLRFMPRNTSPIQATFATGPNLIPLCRRPPRLFGNPTSVDSNIHPQRLPFFAPSIIISPRPPYDHQNSPHCQNRSDTNSRSISTGSLINQGWTTYRYPQGRFGSPQKSTGKKYSSHAQGYLKIPLTREEVLVNERIAQCRAAIKRHMVLRSYLIFRKKGPVPIDPTFLANHPS